MYVYVREMGVERFELSIPDPLFCKLCESGVLDQLDHTPYTAG
jgi:hypothetical protein